MVASQPVAGGWGITTEERHPAPTSIPQVSCARAGGLKELSLHLVPFMMIRFCLLNIELNG